SHGVGKGALNSLMGVALVSVPQFVRDLLIGLTRHPQAAGFRVTLRAFQGANELPLTVAWLIIVGPASGWNRIAHRCPLPRRYRAAASSLSGSSPSTPMP